MMRETNQKVKHNYKKTNTNIMNTCREGKRKEPRVDSGLQRFRIYIIILYVKDFR